MRQFVLYRNGNGIRGLSNFVDYKIVAIEPDGAESIQVICVTVEGKSVGEASVSLEAFDLFMEFDKIMAGLGEFDELNVGFVILSKDKLLGVLGHFGSRQDRLFLNVLVFARHGEKECCKRGKVKKLFHIHNIKIFNWLE